MPKEILTQIENSLNTREPMSWDDVMAATGLSVTECIKAWYSHVLA